MNPSLSLVLLPAPVETESETEGKRETEREKERENRRENQRDRYFECVYVFVDEIY